MVVYVPPRVTSGQLFIFFDAIESLLGGSRYIPVIVGDFNIPEYINVTSYLHTRNTQLVSNCCNLLNLNQRNHVVNSNERLLDLVLASDNCSVEKAEDLMVTEDPHHPALYIKINKLSSHKQSHVDRSGFSSYNFRFADLPSLYTRLLNTSWESVLSKLTVNDAVDEFYATLHSCLLQYVPKTSPKKRHSFPPWFTGDIKQKIRLKYLAWRKYKASGDVTAYQEFRKLRADIKNNLKSSYATFSRQVENQITVDPKKFWSFVDRRSNNVSLPSSISYLNRTAAGPREVVDAFAARFANAFSSLSSHLLDGSEVDGDDRSLCNAELLYVD